MRNGLVFGTLAALLAGTACGTDELPRGYTVIHGAAAALRLNLNDAQDRAATVAFADSLDIGGFQAPVKATSTAPERTEVVVDGSGSSRQDVLVTADALNLRADTLEADDAVQLYQRVWTQTLNINVTSDDGTTQKFPGLLAGDSPLTVTAATAQYVVNVSGRDVTLTGGFGPSGATRTIADIKFLVVVQPPEGESAAYAVLGIAPGSSTRPAAVLRGTPAP